MAVRGKEAKAYIAKKLKEIFEDDFLGETGGKIYVKAPDSGTKIQVAISMSCPTTTTNFSGGLDGGAFSLSGDTETVVPKLAEPVNDPVNVTETETENIKKLLAELGL